MERDFETVMIEQCAPTLAGLKPASLFRYEAHDRDALLARVAGWNAQLGGRGLRMAILKECRRTRCYLIYLYRATALGHVLGRPEVRAFLMGEGYRLAERARGAAECGAVLAQLAARLRCAGDFPHEIGIFLGYPLEDVVGFIENRGKNFTCCGCWKAYGDPEAARRVFARFQKCTSVYLRLFHRGTPILRLAVAA